MAGVLHIELGLKIPGYVLWSVIAPALGFKTISGLLDTSSTHTRTHARTRARTHARTHTHTHTHTGFAYAHLTETYSCDYIGYVRYVRHAARSSKNHM